MPISDDIFTETGRDVAELAEIVAPLVYEQVTEPSTPSDVLTGLPADGQRTATETRVAERFDVDELELTTQAVRLVLDELVNDGYLSRRLVPAPGTPSGFQVFYRRAETDDDALDELRETASASLSSSADDSGDSDEESASAAEQTAETTTDSPATMNLDPSTLEPGTVIEDRYRLEQALGGKSETSVWRATDTETSHAVILKLATGDGADLVRNEAAILRKLQETELAETLPAVIAEYERENGAILVKEVIEGMTLEELVETEGGLADDEVVYILEELTDIVATCHANDIIVQNLLPEDIILQPDGTVSLVDFDIAIDLAGSGPILHPQTPYTPPEVGEKREEMDEPIGAASDVYQLGLVGIFLRVGTLPQDRPEQGLSPVDYGRESAIGSVLERATREPVADRFDSAIVFHRRIRAQWE
ncbi:protein kinase domain-containing protein [Halosegnis longus]|uniref:protein kinase domain-containing protein n=1 Tax=Halosegnis longus TaxID=2216012 RepID=UPI00096A4250|nr:hypothetical protein [Halosegnis longus]